MTCPPYHFTIVAAAAAVSADEHAPSILYRGSLPAQRNATFLHPLGIKTCICLSKREPKHDEHVATWSSRSDACTEWIMVKKLTEEELGMGRTEVCDVLKMILDRSAYPIYLADVDGESHSTLVIACLRKLQGWHMDNYQNSPLANFVAAFSSSDTLQLPPPPYPDWLWPTPPVGRDPEIAFLLPFPHPLLARRHPSMRLQYPAQDPPAKLSPAVPSKSKLGGVHHPAGDTAQPGSSRREPNAAQSPTIAPAVAASLPASTTIAHHQPISAAHLRRTTISSVSGSTGLDPALSSRAPSEAISDDSAELDDVGRSDGGDDEDDDEGDDEDDEDDSNEYRTAPPSESLYMSALDLAEVSRKDGRSMDDNLLARLRK